MFPKSAITVSKGSNASAAKVCFPPIVMNAALEIGGRRWLHCRHLRLFVGCPVFQVYWVLTRCHVKASGASHSKPEIDRCARDRCLLILTKRKPETVTMPTVIRFPNPDRRRLHLPVDHPLDRPLARPEGESGAVHITPPSDGKHRPLRPSLARLHPSGRGSGSPCAAALDRFWPCPWFWADS